MATNGAPSLYDLLGVAPDASQPELTRAYRRRARELHPDLAPDADQDEFRAVTRAYRLLSDPARRSSYDTALRDPYGRARSSGTRIAVRVRRVAPSASPKPGARQSPIVAGPTVVFPNDPGASR
jgi:curved DNA-binding protein CbpA